MKTKRAILKSTVKLLGTSLEIEAGTIVLATEATNLPGPNQWFIRPEAGWSDGIERSEDDSILVNGGELAKISTVKHFTTADVHNPDSDFPRIYLGEYREDLEHCPLAWQKLGLQQTASGYGAKLVSSYKVHFNGKPYRVYHTCYGNASSAWFTVKGKRIYLS